MELTTLVTGTGVPVTVVAHGLGATLPQTRALLGGVPGTKVFPQARGHGSAPAPSTPGYGELAADLARVADSQGATQALGISMGAATILRLLSSDPTRFDRVVLFLPASLDGPRRDEEGLSRTSVLATALRTGDRVAALALVRRELPGDLSGPLVEAYVDARVDFLLASPALPDLFDALAGDRAVPDRGVLSAVTADVLVLAQEGDALHPAQIGRDLVTVLPHARLVVFDRPGVVFRERRRLRGLIVDHLTP